MDGNVVRVLTRLYGVAEPLPRVRDAVEPLARALVPDDRPGDFAQALMDLGATVCIPRAPRCGACPWQAACAAFAGGRPEAYPVRAAKKERPIRRGVAFWVERHDGAVLLRRRPERGLLGGMMEVPSTEWREKTWTETEAVAAAPVRARWRLLAGTVHHTFTHFHLELTVLAGQSSDGADADGVWCPTNRLSAHALPSVMKKVIRLALSQENAQQGATGRRKPAS